MSAASGPVAYLRDHRGLAGLSVACAGGTALWGLVVALRGRGTGKRLACAGLFVLESAIAACIVQALRQDPGPPEAPGLEPVTA